MVKRLGLGKKNIKLGIGMKANILLVSNKASDASNGNSTIKETCCKRWGNKEGFMKANGMMAKCTDSENTRSTQIVVNRLPTEYMNLVK